MCHLLFTGFCGNRRSSFFVILLTNKLTNADENINSSAEVNVKNKSIFSATRCAASVETAKRINILFSPLTNPISQSFLISNTVTKCQENFSHHMIYLQQLSFLVCKCDTFAIARTCPWMLFDSNVEKIIGNISDLISSSLALASRISSFSSK